MSDVEKTHKKEYSRHDFLNTVALAAGAITLKQEILPSPVSSFPDGERLGRIASGRVDIKLRPHYDSPNIGIYYEDTVIPCFREVLGKFPVSWPFRNNQRWLETEDGYIWSPEVQPVKNIENSPLSNIPEGKEGFWVEVTVPWVNVTLDNPPARSTWWSWQASKNLPYRFYYNQILWVDLIEVDDDSQIWYRINERYGNKGDLLWGPGEAFRPISEDELEPISPEVEDKQIVVDVTDSHQYLACYEEGREVYFCRISSGKIPFETPLTAYGSPGFNIWRKLNSLQMSGGTNQAGWEIPGIGWVALFRGDGIAIHSTFWHNNFGEPSSHGCINAAPDDAKWIFRWSSPVTPFEVGDIVVSGKIGTPVKVIEY